MSDPVQITLDQAYEEACLAVGELTVEKRLMAKSASQQIEALSSEKAAVEAQLAEERKPAECPSSPPAA